MGQDIGNPEQDSTNPFDVFQVQQQLHGGSAPPANPFDTFDTTQTARAPDEGMYAPQDASRPASTDVLDKGTLQAAGVAYATSAATLPEQVKNWYFGHMVANRERQMAEMDSPAMAWLTPEQRQQAKDQLLNERNTFVEKYGKNVEALNVAQQLVSEARPQDANIVQDAIIATAQSAPQLLATVGAGIVGGPATGAAVGLGLGGAMQAGQTEQEAVAKTGSFQQADAPALINGILEGLGEAVGAKGLFNQSKGAVMKMAVALGYEATQEGVTQFLQDIVSKVTYDPSITPAEMGRNAAVAFLSGAMSGGAAKPVEMAVHAGVEASQARAQDRLVGQEMERSFAQMPSPEAVALRGMRPEQPPPPSFAEGPYSLAQPGYESTVTAKPPELQVAELTGIKLPKALEEAAQYRQQLEQYGAQPPMPLLPYEEKELAAVTKALDLLATAAPEDLISPQIPEGTITRAILEGTGREKAIQALQLLNADYTTRALTGEPFAGASGNLVTPLGIQNLGTAAWSSNPALRAGETLSTADLKQGHAYVLQEQGMSQEQVHQLVSAARVMRSWLDKMGFKGQLNLAVGLEQGSPLGSLTLADENSLLVRLQTADESRKFYSTAAHEMGHGLAWVMLARSSPQVQAAIRALWASDTRRALGHDLLETAKGAQTGPVVGLQFGRVAEQLAHEYSQGIRAGARDYSTFTMRPYYFSYTEWLAHRFERMLAGNFMEMQKEIEAQLGGNKGAAGLAMRFLQRAWQRLKSLYEVHQAALARTEADATFEAFVKMHARLAEANAGQPSEPPSKIPTEGLPTIIAAAPEPLPGIAKSTGRAQNKGSRSFDTELDKFGQFRKTFGNLLSLAKVNPHIEPLQRYMQRVLMWANEKMNWVSRADLRLREWRKLSTKQRSVLTEFLFDQTQAKKFFDLQDPAVQAKYPMSAETLALYDRIKQDFEDFNSSVENALVAETIKRMTNSPFVQSEVAQLRKRFADMRSRPYFPMTHFGPYYTLVRNSQGKVVASPSYDTRLGQKLAAGKLAKSFPGHELQQRKGSATAQAYSGLRPELLEAMKDKLNLTVQQRKELDQYLLEIAPGQSYAKHMIARKSTPGFTFDAQRQYASYFQKGAGFLARILHGQPMREAVGAIEQSAKQSGAPDAVVRQRIADYAAAHLNYLMEPQNEWTGFRGALAIAFLGMRLRTAVINLTQPVVFTYPYLAARFGDLRTLSEMKSAYADLPKAFRATRQMDKATAAAYDKWTQGLPMTPAEDKLVSKYTGLDKELRLALQQAQKENVLDQSFAMELAAQAEGNVLNKLAATNSLAYLGRAVAHGMMVPFQLAEEVNRRVTFMAAYRLASKGGMNAQQAYTTAVDAVRSTQFEYGKWNRPELTRGPKGVMFLFMQYQLSALHFLLGGDPGWWRGLALLFFLGGLEGLPFAQDLLNLATWMLSSANVRFDAKHWLNERVKDLGGIFEDHPDLLLQGLSRYSGPTDLSGSLSLGRLMPGAEVAAKPGTWDQKLLALEKDAGGAFTGLVMNSYRALVDDTMPMQRRLETGMPIAFVKDIMTAERWLQAGSAQSMNGTEIADVTPTEAGLKALGFGPRGVAQAMEDLQTKNDFVTFYTLRRASLTTEFDRAIQSGDKQEIDTAVAAIRQFNEDVPVPALRVNMSDVLQSHKEREKGRRQEEVGVGRGKIERGVVRGLRGGQL